MEESKTISKTTAKSYETIYTDKIDQVGISTTPNDDFLNENLTTELNVTEQSPTSPTFSNSITPKFLFKDSHYLKSSTSPSSKSRSYDQVKQIIKQAKLLSTIIKAKKLMTESYLSTNSKKPQFTMKYDKNFKTISKIFPDQKIKPRQQAMYTIKSENNINYKSSTQAPSFNSISQTKSFSTFINTKKSMTERYLSTTSNNLLMTRTKHHTNVKLDKNFKTILKIFPDQKTIPGQPERYTIKSKNNINYKSSTRTSTFNSISQSSSTNKVNFHKMTSKFNSIKHSTTEVKSPSLRFEINSVKHSTTEVKSPSLKFVITFDIINKSSNKNSEEQSNKNNPLKTNTGSYYKEKSISPKTFDYVSNSKSTWKRNKPLNSRSISPVKLIQKTNKIITTPSKTKSTLSSYVTFTESSTRAIRPLNIFMKFSDEPTQKIYKILSQSTTLKPFAIEKIFQNPISIPVGIQTTTYNRVTTQPSPWKIRNNSFRSNSFETVCDLQKDSGYGSDTYTSWYYNGKSRKCEWFPYYGNGGNGNRFYYRANCEHSCIEEYRDFCAQQNIINCKESWLTCQMESDTNCQRNYGKKSLKCPPRQPICTDSRKFYRQSPIFLMHRYLIPSECHLPNDPGSCLIDSSSSLVYYYNPIINDCRGFLFTNCGGNINKFISKSDCMNRCAI